MLLGFWASYCNSPVPGSLGLVPLHILAERGRACVCVCVCASRGEEEKIRQVLPFHLFSFFFPVCVVVCPRHPHVSLSLRVSHSVSVAFLLRVRALDQFALVIGRPSIGILFFSTTTRAVTQTPDTRHTGQGWPIPTQGRAVSHAFALMMKLATAIGLTQLVQLVLCS
jgi:hypothetical protein